MEPLHVDMICQFEWMNATSWCPLVISWFITPSLVISATLAQQQQQLYYIYMYPYVYQLSDSELGHHFVYPPIKSNVAMEIPYNRGFELINHLETMDCSMLRSCKSWLGLGVQETIAGEKKQTLCCPLGSTGHRCGFRNGGSSMLGCWAVGAEAVANLKKVDMCVYIYNLYIYIIVK